MASTIVVPNHPDTRLFGTDIFSKNELSLISDEPTQEKPEVVAHKNHCRSTFVFMVVYRTFTILFCFALTAVTHLDIPREFAHAGPPSGTSATELRITLVRRHMLGLEKKFYELMSSSSEPSLHPTHQDMKPKGVFEYCTHIEGKPTIFRIVRL
ncbi:protease s8 tripeptidyl peptidase [Moniliophthora roreri]|nr:protease s8 tripeptidyl peptidase [Moniliophthora roreri]